MKFLRPGDMNEANPQNDEYRSGCCILAIWALSIGTLIATAILL